MNKFKHKFFREPRAFRGRTLLLVWGALVALVGLVGVLDGVLWQTGYDIRQSFILLGLAGVGIGITGFLPQSYRRTAIVFRSISLVLAAIYVVLLWTKHFIPTVVG